MFSAGQYLRMILAAGRVRKLGIATLRKSISLRNACCGCSSKDEENAVTAAPDKAPSKDDQD